METDDALYVGFLRQGMVQVLDKATGAELARIGGCPTLHGEAYDPRTGRTFWGCKTDVMVVGTRGEEKGRLVGRIPLPAGAPVRVAAFAKGANDVLRGYTEGPLSVIYRLNTGAGAYRLEPVEAYGAIRVAATPAGTKLLLLGADGTLRGLDGRTGRLLWSAKIASAFPDDLDEDAGQATMPDIRPWGERAAWVSLPHEGRVVLVDLERGEALRSVVTGGAPTRLAWLSTAEFRPEAVPKEAPYSRSGYAAALLRFAEPGWTPPAARSGTGPRPDVPADQPAAPVVEAVLARGWMQGDGRGFSPDRPVTRQEAAVALMRAGLIAPGKAGAGSAPLDLAAAAPWARDAVRSLVAHVPAFADGGRSRPTAPVDPAWWETVREALAKSSASPTVR